MGIAGTAAIKRVSSTTDVSSAVERVESPRAASSTPPPPRLTYNTAGLPLRPSAPPCAFFMRTGHCKYSRDCVHDHPESAVVAVEAVPPSACLPQGSVWQLLLEQQQLQATRTQPSGSLQTAEASLSNLTLEATYPERLGMRDCDFYLKTGRCSFGATCRYNHPKDRQKAAQHFLCDELNNLGLPLREVRAWMLAFPRPCLLSSGDEELVLVQRVVKGIFTPRVSRGLPVCGVDVRTRSEFPQYQTYQLQLDRVRSP